MYNGQLTVIVETWGAFLAGGGTAETGAFNAGCGTEAVAALGAASADPAPSSFLLFLEA